MYYSLVLLFWPISGQARIEFSLIHVSVEEERSGYAMKKWLHHDKVARKLEKQDLGSHRVISMMIKVAAR